MRLIISKDDIVVGVIPDNVTSHLPPSKLGEGSRYFDFDFTDKTKDTFKKLLKKERSSLLGKKVSIKGKGFEFKDKEKRFIDTVHLNINKPKFHKDVEIYAKKAKDKGAKVFINDGEETIIVEIKADDLIVGRMIFKKQGCCTYLYSFGKVFDREYYPHYLGMYEFYKYLKKKGRSYIDLGGLVKDDEDLNNFKKKWGSVAKVEV